MSHRFHVRLYSNNRHACGRSGQLVLHVSLAHDWMAKLEAEAALGRPDISYVTITDTEQGTARKVYSLAELRA
jgi:rRNA pseudouridine-1189 N-methylase Emg1 (Nep1/Mra1 family)